MTDKDSNGRKIDFQKIENETLKHFFDHRQEYLILLALILLLTILLSNLLEDKLLIIGEESYYHLQTSLESTSKNIFYFPLNFLMKVLAEFGNESIVIIPLLLAISSILLYSQLAKKLQISAFFSIIFLSLLIFSPAFLFTFATISAYSYFTFLILAGFLLLAQERERYRYLAMIPFLPATFLDIFSTFLLLALLILYFYQEKKKPSRKHLQRHLQSKPGLPLMLIGVIIMSLLTNIFIFQQPFLLGPFHHQQRMADLISDLGGLSGMSFFLFLLALIGLVAARKQKNRSGLYLLTALAIPAYLYNTRIIYPLTVIAAIFATVGIIKLFEKKWVLDSLRKLTLFLLILGIIFSAFTYLDRLVLNSTSVEERNVLQWIKENTEPQAVIFSNPEKSHFIEYFSKRQTFSSLPASKTLSEETAAILSAAYIDELFPLLEKNQINFLYLTKEMKEQLPQNYGLLFLLKNEKFKLVHSRGDTEVWSFRK